MTTQCTLHVKLLHTKTAALERIYIKAIFIALTTMVYLMFRD